MPMVDGSRRPCQPWITEADLCAPCLDISYDMNLEPYLIQASELLYKLSGDQFPGICTEVVQPCSQQVSTATPTQYEPFVSVPMRTLTLESPFPWTGCGHRKQVCHCKGYDSIALPHPYIQTVTEVTTDGSALSPDSYELTGRYLIRTDGLRWPTCDDTFQVTYSHGRNPPLSGIKAAGVLACELFLSCEPEVLPKAKCRLPRNLASISRQGVTVLFESLTRTGGPFRMGILEVDLFLEAYGSTPRSTFLSPDDIDLARRVP